MPEISIIIPTYEKAFYLDLTLAGFVGQTKKDFEIIIINDGSEDHTEQIINKYSNLDIKYLHQQHQGRAKARNRALGIAEGRYIIFNDDDRIPHPSLVQTHFDSIVEGEGVVSIGDKQVILTRYQKNLSIIFHRLVDMLRKNPQLFEHIINSNEANLVTPEEVMNFFEATVVKWHFWQPRDNYMHITQLFGDHLEGFELGWVLCTTGNMAYDREYNPGVLFDENFKGWGCEDTEFSYQLKLRNYQFKVNRNSINYHQVHPRNPSEGAELQNNLKYLLAKYNSFEIALFIRFFNNKISLVEANSILATESKKGNDLLINDYMSLFKNAL